MGPYDITIIYANGGDERLRRRRQMESKAVDPLDNGSGLLGI
jgi:hypothetical protein